MAWTPRRLAGVLGGVLLLVVLGIGALDPAPADAQINNMPSTPIDAVKNFIGTVGDAAEAVGGEMLQQALEWLLGGLETVITLWLVKFLVTIHVPLDGPLETATGPLIVIGGFFLVVGLITSVADGYREIIAGTDTAPRVIGQAVFRVIGLALLLAAWPWVLPLAVDVANGMTGYVLSDAAVADALRNTFAAGKLNPLLWLLAAIFLAIAMLILIVLKFVIAIAFACLYVGGPALIGFAALPRVGSMALSMATRGVVTLTAIPLAWTVVFVAWASVSGGMFAEFDGDGKVAGLMGPALFVAGLVIMLAVTRKLLSMANMGLRTAPPGAGVARSAVNITAARAAMGAAGLGAGAAGAGEGAAAPVKGGSGEPIRGAHTQRTDTPTRGQASGGTQTAQKQPRSLLGGAGGGAGGAQSDHAERKLQQARDAQTRREEDSMDAVGLFQTKAGALVSRGMVQEGERQRLAERAEKLRAEHGTDGVPPDVLKDKARALSVSDRSALSGLADAVQREYPDDPHTAANRYQDAVLDRASGSVHRDSDREAAAYVAAASPATVKESFQGDYDTFSPRRPDHPGDRGSAGGYDPDTFAHGRPAHASTVWGDRPGPSASEGRR